MGKKKKPQQHRPKVQAPQGVESKDLIKQQEAVKRLATIMQAMSAPPEPLLSLFERLGIPFEIVENVPGDPSFDTVVIKVTDLVAGEERNQAQGSTLARLYGKGDPAAMLSKVATGGQLPPNTHNPQTGVKLPTKTSVSESLSGHAGIEGRGQQAQRPSFADLLNQAQERATEMKGATQYSPKEPPIETKPFVAQPVSDDEDDDYLKGIQG
ncbi:hypothetical protein HWB51_gp108 [Mycobacterium phage Cuke]|uniref:Uncharacterized protein n=1 Tax=Mycobacterium phage Cuke TaxID=2079417 RepID=A0A2L1IWZ7_9CAUD|nr:hypothetical protein HWB51_gp108 [Mycobacterium phage Cuke]AVD99704.1 hypothetical protein SEA_CUKE_88 [Mycobacterium phage Cuke]